MSLSITSGLKKEPVTLCYGDEKKHRILRACNLSAVALNKSLVHERNLHHGVVPKQIVLPMSLEQLWRFLVSGKDSSYSNLATRTGDRYRNRFHLYKISMESGRYRIQPIRRAPPSMGSQALGSIFFQCLLCSSATCQIVSVAVSDATSGGSSGGISPRIIFVTARDEAAMAGKQ